MSNHGGKREGAGRPSTGVNDTVVIRVDSDLKPLVDEIKAAFKKSGIVLSVTSNQDSVTSNQALQAKYDALLAKYAKEVASLTIKAEGRDDNTLLAENDDLKKQAIALKATVDLKQAEIDSLKGLKVKAVESVKKGKALNKADYDGIAPLAKPLSKLIGYGVSNDKKSKEVTAKIKSDLGITSKARKLPPNINQQIYSHLVELYSQSNNDEPVEIISQPTNDDPVNIISQDNQPTTPEPKTEQQTPVELFSQPDNDEPVEIISQVNNFDNVRLAFYIVRKGERERQVIALDGFFINALASIGIAKQDAPQWVQTQVDDWTAFDGQLPITRQVKYLIMLAVVKGLGGNENVFYNLN